MKNLFVSVTLLLGLAPSCFAQGTLSGTLTTDTTLGIDDSPWTVDSTVTVPVGVTLTIEEGVRVDFEDGTGIVVDGGRMIANGREAAPVVFGRPAGSTHTWDGFVFEDTLEDNRLTHFVMEYGDDAGQSIEVTRARLTIQFGDWPTTEETMIELDEPSVIIEDSAIPGISGGEVIHGKDLVAPGWLILRRNTFGEASNGGDVIDFTGAEAPGPVLQVIDNFFMGGDDDGLDLDGTDAFVSDNIFMNFRKEDSNNRATTSNAIATGLPQTGAPNRTKVTLVRNLFLNCDHAVLLKEEAFLTAENNTFVGMNEAVIQFNEVGGTSVRGPGKGAYLEGNLFWDNELLFKYVIGTTELTINQCLIDSEFHDRGFGNLDSDPGFVDPVNSDDAIPLDSPVVGTGPNGIDMGFMVSGDASISGEPPTNTWSGEATLVVDGPAIRHYRYRLNGGVWSGETPVDDPIVLSGLTGANFVEVIGRNEVGDWQEEDDATQSRMWTVDPSFAEVVLNEIDVAGGSVEIWNNSGGAIDLNGYLVNDIPIAGVDPITPGGFLVLSVEGLGMSGGTVELEDAGGASIDSLTYGIQIEGSSLGRLGADWVLTKPTPGSANVRQPLAIGQSLKLNEWLLNSDCLFTGDFIELYNPDGLPASLASVEVVPSVLLSGENWAASPLSFIGATDYTTIVSDGEMANFDVSGEIGIEIDLIRGGEVIDFVTNQSEVTDVSEGRVTPGGEDLATFDLPTPGFGVTINEVETETGLVAIDAVWSYEDSDTDLGTEWRASAYDDSGWETGEALLGRETSPDNLPETLETEVDYVSGKPTYYFRHRFQFAGDPTKTELRLRTVVDDGAVIYLNGVEWHRLRMDDPVGHGTFASDNVGDADYEGPFDLPASSLIVGENVLAVEVHQDDAGSSDIVFGLELQAVETELVREGLGDAEAILSGLRITEIMYHPAGDGEGEFLELRNTGETPFDLNGVKFVAGVNFEFPAMILNPGGFVYVVKSAAAFGHPELNVAGEYSGELDDSGERLRLELGFGAGVVDTTYSNNPIAGAGGGGNSLELMEDLGLKGGRWMPGASIGGSLGAVSVFQEYEVWLNEVFSPAERADPEISAGDRDPDGDGLVNRLEHLFGGDPMMADHSDITLRIDGDEISFGYTRSMTAKGQLFLSGSDDLVNWSRNDDGALGEVISQSDGRQQIQVKFPLGLRSRRFFRMEGTQ